MILCKSKKKKKTIISRDPGRSGPADPFEEHPLTPLYLSTIVTIVENLSTCLAYIISNQIHRRREITSMANTVTVTIYLRNIHRDLTIIEAVRIVTSYPRRPIHYVSIDQLCSKV